MRERRDGGELSASVLRLTHALYRVTDLMPRDEPLRRGIREKAGEIFSLGVATAHGRANREEKADEAWIGIEILLGYLAMARVLGCANPINFLVLEREYRLLAETLGAMSGEDTMKQGGGEEAYGRRHDSEPSPLDDNKGIQKNDTAVGAGARHPPAVESKMNGVNERQRKIMERLAAAGQVKISDFYDTFDAISSKTIQRDLQDLTTRNIIKKQGEKRWTMYTLA